MIKKSYLLLVMLQTLFIMNVRAQELKTPTLEDLIPGGETFRFPENLYGLQWWGDECIKPDIDTLFAVNPKTGKERVIATRESVNRVLEQSQAGKLSYFYNVRFPWADKAQMLIEMPEKYIVYDLTNSRIVSTVATKKGAANPDYCTVNGNVAYTVGNNLYVNDTQVTDEPFTGTSSASRKELIGARTAIYSLFTAWTNGWSANTPWWISPPA